MAASVVLWRLLRIALFIGALWYLAGWLDYRELTEMLRAASPLHLLLTLACVLLAHLLRGLRLRLTLSAIGQQVSWMYTSAVYAISAFWGRITPGKMGEFARIGYFADRGKLLPYLLLERVMDAASIAVISAPLLLLLAPSFHYAAYAGLALLALLLFIKPLRQSCYRLLGRILVMPEQAPGKFLATMAAQSFLSWIASLSALYFAATATGTAIQLWEFLPAAAAAVAVGIVSGTPGGFGTREATLAYLLTLTSGLTMPAATALAVYAIIAVTLSEFILFLLGNLLETQLSNKRAPDERS